MSKTDLSDKGLKEEVARIIDSYRTRVAREGLMVRLVKMVRDQARDEQKEKSARVVEFEVCDGECDCFSCEMLRKIARTIRGQSVVTEERVWKAKYLLLWSKYDHAAADESSLAQEFETWQEIKKIAEAIRNQGEGK